MKIKFNKASGKTTITLDWQEHRQFLASSAAVEVVREAIVNTVSLVDNKQEKKKN